MKNFGGISMKSTSKNGFNQIWKRNAVAGAITLFVCAAVYLNWTYQQEAEMGKMLGEATMVGSETTDPLLQEDVMSSDLPNYSDLSETVDNTAQIKSDYYATARLNRQQARDSALSLLQDAAHGEDTAIAEEANAAIQTMANYTVTEAQIENLVVAKGYTDCVAFMGDDSISLAVSSVEGGMTETDTARIVDVVNQAAGYTASQIKIIEVE